MPLYEYECTQCKLHTEKIQKFSDTEITECPHCGGLLERVVSAPAISFKGGGWYADGYGNAKPSKGENKSDSGTSSDVPSVAAAASANKDSASAATPASSGSSSSATPAAAAPSTSSSDKK